MNFKQDPLGPSGTERVATDVRGAFCLSWPQVESISALPKELVPCSIHIYSCVIWGEQTEQSWPQEQRGPCHRENTRMALKSAFVPIFVWRWTVCVWTSVLLSALLGQACALQFDHSSSHLKLKSFAIAAHTVRHVARALVSAARSGGAACEGDTVAAPLHKAMHSLLRYDIPQNPQPITEVAPWRGLLKS